MGYKGEKIQQLPQPTGCSWFLTHPRNTEEQSYVTEDALPTFWKRELQVKKPGPLPALVPEIDRIYTQVKYTVIESRKSTDIAP